VIDREIKLKRRRRRLRASEMAECLVAMWAAGGERAEHLDPLARTRRWRCCWAMTCRPPRRRGIF